MHDSINPVLYQSRLLPYLWSYDLSMDPDQKGAVWSGFKLFASMINLVWNALQNMSERLKAETFSV